MLASSRLSTWAIWKDLPALAPISSTPVPHRLAGNCWKCCRVVQCRSLVQWRDALLLPDSLVTRFQFVLHCPFV